jgi:fructokinase
MNSPKYAAVSFGEILWDNLPSGSRPGGAPMNVAYHLQKMGLPAALISRTGSDKKGQALRQVLIDNGLTTAFIQEDQLYPTGVVDAHIQPNNEVLYDIIQPVAWDFIDVREGHHELAAYARFFICGSLSARNSVSCHTLFSLIEAAAFTVVDINLRPPHFNKEMISRLLESADLLKLNEHELTLISSWFKELADEEDQVKLLQDRFSISTIVVTKGGEGALVCKDNEILRHKGFSIKLADTVGSGDAFLAGYLFQISRGTVPKECLRFANAMGAYIASREGACPAYGLENIEQLLEQDEMQS